MINPPPTYSKIFLHYLSEEIVPFLPIHKSPISPSKPNENLYVYKDIAMYFIVVKLFFKLKFKTMYLA